MSEHLVALTPAEVPVVQTDLVAWCHQKIVALGRELADARRNVDIAKRAGWKFATYARLATKTRQRMIYFTKIREAVKAGYLVVPNFPVEVMAVRVQRAAPPKYTDSWRSGVTTAKAEKLLPPGVGRYVDDEQFSRDLSYTENDPASPSGKRRVQLYEASGYDDPDFPVTLIKPVVLDATRRAMALKIFDRIGVVTGRQKDPIVIGQILDPCSKEMSGANTHAKLVSFFIAWWLDPETL